MLLLKILRCNSNFSNWRSSLLPWKCLPQQHKSVSYDRVVFTLRLPQRDLDLFFWHTVYFQIWAEEGSRLKITTTRFNSRKSSMDRNHSHQKFGWYIFDKGLLKLGVHVSWALDFLLTDHRDVIVCYSCPSCHRSTEGLCCENRALTLINTDSWMLCYVSLSSICKKYIFIGVSGTYKYVSRHVKLFLIISLYGKDHCRVQPSRNNLCLESQRAYCLHNLVNLHSLFGFCLFFITVKFHL